MVYQVRIFSPMLCRICAYSVAYFHWRCAVCVGLMAVSTGLLVTEQVLRGGGLVVPTVLTDLKAVGGSLFVPLRRRCATLNMFLTGQGLGKALLAHSPTLDQLLQLRNDAREAEVARETVAAAVPSGEVDFAEVLGVESSDSVQTKRPHRRRSLTAADKIVSVRLERSDFAPWSVQLLVGAGNASVHMEATAANYEALRKFVLDDMANSGASKARPPRTSTRGPRGEPEQRDYWRSDRRRWVQKRPAVKLQLDDTAGSKPQKRRR